MCCTALFSCNKSADEAVSAAGVLISRDKLDLHVGETATLTATVLPESLGMGVEWSVLDPEYAEVNGGVVTAKAEGVTYVVATSADGTQKGACMVSVNPPALYDVYIKGPEGDVLTGIYGYPGLSLALSAEASDGKAHEFTWTLEDTSVGTLVAGGNLTLAATASADKNFAFDAQSYLKVVTEDGSGVKIPVRSSLLNGLKLYDDFKSADVAITLQASQAYPVSVLYQGALLPEAIPADAMTIELSNTDDFTLQQENGQLTLVTGPETGVETMINVTLAGLNQKVKVAEIMIEEVCEMEASLVDKTSSTMVFTWTSGISEEDDVAKAYTATLYKDASCTIVDQEFEIPEGCGAWKSKQPKFVFGGLEPNTPYWFRVVTPEGEKSNKVKATTDNFTHVLMPTTITTTGVVLAEDFGEIRWEFDHIADAVGFRPADASSFDNTAVKTTETDTDDNIYNGYHGNGGGEMEYKNQSTAIENSRRLNDWITDTKVYIHPGYLKLGNSTNRGWILTPEFTVPEGKKAVVTVTVTAARYSTAQDVDWGLIVLSPELAMAGHDGPHTAYFEWPDVTDATLYKEVTFDNVGEWMTKSVEGLVVRKGDRIAFGGKSKGDKTKGRVHVSDLTYTITEILDE